MRGEGCGALACARWTLEHWPLHPGRDVEQRSLLTSPREPGCTLPTYGVFPEGPFPAT